MFDISTILELIIVVCAFFGWKYVKPIVKDMLMSKWAYTIVSAANEKNLIGELEDKWMWAVKSMKAKLEKYKITFDEEEVTQYLKSAITALRVDIDGTNAQKVKEESKQG